MKAAITNFFCYKQSDYNSVGQEDEDLSSPQSKSMEAADSQLRSLPKSRWNPWLIAISGAGFLFWSVAVFEIGSRSPNVASCSALTTAWSPMRSMIRYEPVETTGDFFQPSPYRGSGPEVDEAWDKLWMIGGVPIRIKEPNLATLGKTPDRNWTTVPESRGGGYAGYPEVFHQLHCLNMIRLATISGSRNHSLFTDHPEHIVREHINHCIEIIRLQLQCSAEMTPILTENLPGHEFPSPDFKVIHVCKNFDELRVWTEDHLLHGVGGWDIPGAHQ